MSTEAQVAIGVAFFSALVSVFGLIVAWWRDAEKEAIRASIRSVEESLKKLDEKTRELDKQVGGAHSRINEIRVITWTREDQKSFDDRMMAQMGRVQVEINDLRKDLGDKLDRVMALIIGRK